MHSSPILDTDILGYRVAHSTFDDYYGTNWGQSFFGRYLLRVELDTPSAAVFADAVNYGSSNNTAQLTAYDTNGQELGKSYQHISTFGTPVRIEYTAAGMSIKYFTVSNYVSSIFGFQIDRVGTGRLEDANFDGDSIVGVEDINLLLGLGDLTAGVSVSPGINDLFDLNGDGVLNQGDLNQWLADAAVLNNLATPYKRGDADLDGVVDVSDFNRWNASKFTSVGRWDAGDFDGNGVTEVSDFNLWNTNKFTSSLAAAPVPEPTCFALFHAAFWTAVILHRFPSRGRDGHAATTPMGVHPRWPRLNRQRA